jgi:hypothetical protein
MLDVILGRTLTLRPSPDPPGSWALTLGDVALAELAWEDGVVRVETPDEVGRVLVAGTWMVRALLIAGETDAHHLWYVGGLRRGLARCRDGRGFTFVRGIDRRRGPWEGFDDEAGGAVLRIRGRLADGNALSDIAVTPSRAYAASAGPLAVVWGALRMANLRRPWLAFTSAGVSERAVQREMERLDATHFAAAAAELPSETARAVARGRNVRCGGNVAARARRRARYSPATTRLRPSALAR